MAATALEVVAINSKPGGSSRASSPCDIQTVSGPCSPLNSGGIAAQQFDLGVAVLALVGGAHLAAQLVHHELQAVADAQHRQSEMQDALVGRRRIGVIHGRRPARQHNARGRVALDFVERGGAGQDDGEDVLFADAARDELRILRAKVEDDDRLRFHHLLCQRTGAV